MLRRLGLVGAIVFFSLLVGVSSAAAADSVTVQLTPENTGTLGYSETGTVTLTAVGDQTQVVFNLTGAPAGTPQPAHIHVGACPNVGAVKWPLSNVVDGKSTTTVNAKLSDITTGGYAINVHKSAAEIAVYTACGNVAAATTTPSAAPAAGLGGGAHDSGAAAALLAALALAIGAYAGVTRWARRQA